MLSLVLKARNSSGLQNLFINRQEDGGITFCLVGVYEGIPIQIDFDELDPEDVDDLILLLEKRRGPWCRQCNQPHEQCGQEGAGHE